MNRLIPGKTKVQVELFRGVKIGDIIVSAIGLTMVIFVLISSLPYKLAFCAGVVLAAAVLLIRMDGNPNYRYLMHVIAHFAYKRKYQRIYDDALLVERARGNAMDTIVDRILADERAGDAEDGGKKAKPRKKKKKAAAADKKTAGKSKKAAKTDRTETASPAAQRQTRAAQRKEKAAAKREARTAEKARKREDKLLTSAKTPQELKDEILQRRREEAEREFFEGFAKSSAGGEPEDGPARKLTRKEEDALLKSDKISEVEKEAIRERRRRESAEFIQKKAVAKDKNTAREMMQDLIGFTGIKGGYIEYAKDYYGGVIEIDPVEFRFFSEMRRKASIEGCFGRVLRSLHGRYSANIIKLERPVNYDRYLEKEREKLERLRDSYESGMLAEDEYQIRVEISYDRMNELEALCSDDKVIDAFYYLVLFESDKNQLDMMLKDAQTSLQQGELTVRRLYDADLAIFLKYTNQLDFDEHEVEKIAPEDYAKWAQPNIVDIRVRRVEVNHIITHNFRVVSYPMVVGDAWLAGVMSSPGTKVVIKVRQMDRDKAIRGIDRSLMELRGQWAATGVDSRRIEIENHLNTLQELLTTLQGDSEVLLECNVYITAYDIAATRKNMKIPQPPPSFLPTIGDMKKNIRRTWQEAGFRLNNMEFDQMQAFLGSQVSALDPMAGDGRGIPSNTVAACFPWIFSHISDEGGIKLGESGGVPVFIDFFRRDSERVNSNMVIVGKSGSGKSYATKSLLVNLAAEDAKIFILDPENEYTELAENLHGKFINVGNAQYGRLNPFHIITALEDDEGGEETVSGSYATHLQFLEEFFKQILPDCDKDALEYLNNMVDRVYADKGITAETDLSRLRPGDYPIFDDLYEAIFEEFQGTDNQYLRTTLRTLMNYVAKFSRDGRNANIWNGPSTVTTEENFTVFNFQSMLANRNTTIANAQMLLVLKYIDNEIIKNRDYNTRYGLHRKVVVVIDEAHVFIDTKFPVALDFMFQLAKRIRKYNGMQIVITQNIKDFVGSEEIARKSTAIINACQYSFIFALAPNDIQDLVKLYEKAGGINESEQEQITQAPRGQAFTIMGPNSRSTFRVDTPKSMTAMFEHRGYQSHYFSSPQGQEVWEEIVAASREQRAVSGYLPDAGYVEEEAAPAPADSGVTFEELSGEEYASIYGDRLSEEDDSESFVFGEEQNARSYVPTLPPNAPAFQVGAPAQDALVVGIRDLIDTVRGLRLPRTPSAGPGEEIPVPEEENPVSGERDGDGRIEELYRAIETLRRQNEELQESLARAEAAAKAPDSVGDLQPEASSEEDPWALAFDQLPEAPPPEEEDWETAFDEPSEEDPWSLAWDELTARTEPEEELSPEPEDDVWDLEPVPPREEELEEQRRREAEAQEILERSARLISGMTVLERMAASGETVMEITLEDLIAQIAAENRA